MIDDTLDKAVQQHYERQVLPAEIMTRMLSMAENLEQGKQSKQKEGFWHKRWLFQRNLSVAASVVIAMLFTSLLWWPGNKQTVSVAQEVALNHNKQLASEYISDSFQHLASVMVKLDFKPVFPDRLRRSGYQITGARYCSIQGNIAAQIKLRAKNGEILTLYETRTNNELAVLNDKRHSENNVTIQTWQEGGIFFSLAESMN